MCNNSVFSRHLFLQGQVRFPKLAKVARIILAIPATSAASESDLSSAGSLISDKRTAMLPSTANDHLVLRDFLENKDRTQ